MLPSAQSRSETQQPTICVLMHVFVDVLQVSTVHTSRSLHCGLAVQQPAIGAWMQESLVRSHESVVQIRPSSHIASLVQQFGILTLRQLWVN